MKKIALVVSAVLLCLAAVACGSDKKSITVKYLVAKTSGTGLETKDFDKDFDKDATIAFEATDEAKIVKVTNGSNEKYKWDGKYGVLAEGKKESDLGTDPAKWTTEGTGALLVAAPTTADKKYTFYAVYKKAEAEAVIEGEAGKFEDVTVPNTDTSTRDKTVKFTLTIVENALKEAVTAETLKDGTVFVITPDSGKEFTTSPVVSATKDSATKVTYSVVFKGETIPQAAAGDKVCSGKIKVVLPTTALENDAAALTSNEITYKFTYKAASAG